jgi:hypothetical protein
MEVLAALLRSGSDTCREGVFGIVSPGACFLKMASYRSDWAFAAGLVATGGSFGLCFVEGDGGGEVSLWSWLGKAPGVVADMSRDSGDGSVW